MLQYRPVQLGPVALSAMSTESILSTLKVFQKTMSNGDLVEVSTIFPRENVSLVQVSIDHGDPNKVISFVAMSRTHQVGLLGIMQKVEDSEIKAFLRATLCSFL